MKPRTNPPLQVITALMLMLAFAATLAAHPTPTPKASSAGVLLGPCGSSAAQGPNGTDDDFSNRSIDGQILTRGDGLTANPATLVFKNTVENAGRGDDAFMITTPSLPPGFIVEISDDFGEHYTLLDRWTSSITLPVSYRASVTFFTRITAPAGLRLLTGYDTVIRATSSIDPSISNDTINRIYTGFVRLQSSVSFVNGNGSAEIAKASPGSEIEFDVTYSNISVAAGVGNSTLTATNLVIVENGNVAPNNWGSRTEHIVGASDSLGGYIVGDKAGSTSLTDIVMTLGPGQSGTFKFRRRIK